MTARLWGGIAFLVVLVFIYATRGILLPFILGLAVAYLLDPVADRMEAVKIPRGIAAALVIFAFFGLSIGAVLALWPVFQAQLAAIAEVLPSTLAQLRPWLEDFVARNNTMLSELLGQDLESILLEAAQGIMGHVQAFAARLVSEGLALFNVLSLLLISPVVAFYLLRDWDLLVAKVDRWLPRSVGPTIRDQLGKIDTVLSGFVRGQMMICLIMGILYAVGWTAVGLNFGLILGFFAGVLAFVPFVGVFFVLLVAMVAAIGQWGFDAANLGLVGGVFLIVQTFEGMILTPKLMEDRIGLHPVWVLFAAFAGGELLGFVGILLALPIAASIAVLVRFVIERYEQHYGLVSSAVPDAVGVDARSEGEAEDESKDDDRKG